MTETSRPPLIAGLFDLVTLEAAGQGSGNMEVVIATAGQYKNVLGAAADNRSRVRNASDFETFASSIEAIRTVIDRGDGGAAGIIARSVLNRWWN